MRRVLQITFYSALTLIWLLILLYFIAVVVTSILILRSGQPWWMDIPGALEQAFRPAFLATAITTWQTALIEGILYLVAFVLSANLTLRLIFNMDQLKEYANPGNGPVLLSDTWFEPEAAENDTLGYSAIAHEIAQTIMRSANETPFAIAIEGRWGIGKTSVMKMVEKELKGNHTGKYFPLTVKDETTGKEATTEWKNFTIWFNPWRHRRWEAQKAFMSAVFSEIPWRALSWYVSPFMRRRMLSQLANLVSFVRGRNNMSVSITNRLDVNAPYRNRFQTDFQDFLQYWSHAEGGTHINLVIFIDDLDRCDPSDIRPILDSLKLFFESKNCVFVLGFDPSFVAKSIEREPHGMIPDGLVYLQKIIQAEYRLSLPSDDDLRNLIEAYRTRSHLQREFDIIARAIKPENYSDLILTYTHRTPRQMKRVINGLVIALPLLHEDDENSYADTFYLLLFLIRWPQVYDTFREALEMKESRADKSRYETVCTVNLLPVHYARLLWRAAS